MKNYQNNEAIDVQDQEEAEMTPKTIWRVFFVLLGLTALEFIIALGFVHTGIISKGPAVIIIYIVLTIAKAFYIIAYFMHLKFENMAFKLCLGIMPIALMAYITILVLIEGNYLKGVYHIWELWTQ
ncbi:MAG TPA: cytochrome C oxidase subunit IV family protein [Sphingobacterium sp.]|nr:cytochrome C oxidase subunit IV family protein [Sphingobacterium sp.]